MPADEDKLRKASSLLVKQKLPCMMFMTWTVMPMVFLSALTCQRRSEKNIEQVSDHLNQQDQSNDCNAKTSSYCTCLSVELEVLESLF